MFIHQFIEYLHDNVWRQIYKSDRKNRNNTGSIRKAGVCVCVCTICCSEQNKASHRKVYDNLFLYSKTEVQRLHLIHRWLCGEDGGGWIYTPKMLLTFRATISQHLCGYWVSYKDGRSIRLSVKCDVEVSDVKTGHADKQTFSRVRSRRPQLSDTNLHHMIPDQENLPCQQLKKE